MPQSDIFGGSLRRTIRELNAIGKGALPQATRRTVNAMAFRVKQQAQSNSAENINC